MRLDEEERLRELPTVLRAIVRALGWERATEFLREHGGQPKAIPQCRARHLGLSAVEVARLNEELAVHLEYNSKRVIKLPKVDKIYLQTRNARILSAAQSSSVSRLARDFRLTTRRIEQIKARAQNEDEQHNLF